MKPTGENVEVLKALRVEGHSFCPTFTHVTSEVGDPT
jgi:hypothetical protein